MKRLAVLTISLALALGALFSGGAVAFAESETQYNPEEFIKTLTFTELSDYAVSGQTYAFAQGSEVCVYSDGERTIYTHNAQVTALDAEDGTFYFKDATNSVYSLPDKEASTHEIKPAGIITDKTEKFTYRVKDDGKVQIGDLDNEQFITLDDFSNPKKFADTIYAVKDNWLYTLSGTEYEKIADMKYTDFPKDGTILTGNTAKALKEDYSLKFVSVKSGSFITEVSLASLDGEYLSTGETVTVQEDFIALLLCYTGNAAIIAQGDKSYIASLTPADEINISCGKAPEFESATVTGNEIYASPYVNKGTSQCLAADIPDRRVTIVSRIEFEGVLGANFYEVKYTVDEQEYTGYVTEGLVIEDLFGENREPVSHPDPNYKDKNNVTTVVLVLIVITLILAAAGYLTYIGTGGKFKKKRKNNSDKSE